MIRSSGTRRVRVGFLILASTIALTACGGEPTPPRLVHFSPVVLLVPTDETVAIRVVFERNDFDPTRFAWTAEAGDIQGDGGAEIVYAAPSEPGNYEISVTAAYGEGEDAGELTLAGSIKVIPGASHLTVEGAEEPDQPPRSIASEPADVEGAEASEGASEPTGRAADETPDEPAAAALGTADPGSDPVEALARADTSQRATVTAPAGDRAQPPSTPEQPDPTTAQTEETPVGEQARPADDPAKAKSPDPEVADTVAKAPAPAGGPAAPAPVAGAAPIAGSRLDRILADEQLIAAVQIAFHPFSFEDDGGARVGFEIDLVREFARRWLDDPDALELMPVPTARRIPTLLAGEADIVAAALTKTPERAEQVDFSLTYFQDGQRLLVAEGSDITSVCDLAGKQVAAIESSTSLANLRREALACGFEPDEVIVVFDHHMDAVQALLNGQVAAFTSDGLALEGFAADRPLEVVGNHFSEEPYGIAVPKGDRRLLDLVDATLAEMAADGTFAALYAKWFGDEIAPYPLDEVDLATDPGALASLVTSDAPPLFEPDTVEPNDRATGAVQEYVVEPGDTLSKIAGKLHGDVSPVSWQRIYEANRDLIGEDPSRIEAGMTLVIPE
jgi:ABC-type amino acid transport substrate-binding protein